MAEGNKASEMHIQNLANFCRICGNRLNKFKEMHQTTYSCKEYQEFLEINFQIDIEKDDPAIHPPRCNSCYRSHTRERFYWEVHTEDNSAHVEEKKRLKRVVDQKNRNKVEENTSPNNPRRFLLQVHRQSKLF